MSFDKIPDELRQRVQWVVWQPSKIPCCARTGKPASVTDPQTWSSFDEAVTAFQCGNGRYAGIGFVFTADDPYCGIDLDHSDDPVIVARQQKIFEEFNSYSEFSPSGKGLHIIIRADFDRYESRVDSLGA
ncbi:hypothetical protein ACTDI4_13335 [Mesorhizobium sp. PUT5]|uniref:hypothetical protein n=1 Tax=Mesorhizobium sp. PUT5 TaxID=3454629 RepID=UPI003FA49C5E